MTTTPDSATSGLVTAEVLQPLVEAWLPSQRWFPGKGRTATFVVERLGDLQEEPPVTVWTVRAEYGPDDYERYQLPLVVHRTRAENLDHVLLGTLHTDDGPRWIYDALHDKDVTQTWLRGMQAQSENGPVRYSRYVEADDIPVDQQSLVLSGEQSNTSMAFGDAAIMKVFRRLQPGVNPDIEVQAALSKLGAKHIARLLGSAEADVDGVATSLAMLQQFMTTATDGWELAKASVRDLMAEADLHAAEAGGDFAGEAHRLGMAVAEVHADLAVAFGVNQLAADQLAARSNAMLQRLEKARAIVSELDEVADGLAKTFRAVGDLGDAVTVQRIHGDLHLGQVLRTVQRWVLIDFEGEPMASIESRRDFDSPLRDVAGMLRSFDYAGHHRLIETPFDAQLSYRATEWAERNQAAFCEGYGEGSGADPRTHRVLLRAFEADKAVYEAVYEARNRPNWLPIPVASLTRLANDGGDA